MAQLIFNDRDRVGDWVATMVGQRSSWGGFYAMGIEKDGEIVAGVVINNINGSNATCHVAIAKTNKLLPKLFEAVADYSFRQLGLKRLTGMVPSTEPHILKFDKHVGFEEEFVMKDGAPGADMHVLVLWPHKCRWLRKE